MGKDRTHPRIGVFPCAEYKVKGVDGHEVVIMALTVLCTLHDRNIDNYAICEQFHAPDGSLRYKVTEYASHDVLVRAYRKGVGTASVSLYSFEQESPFVEHEGFKRHWSVTARDEKPWFLAKSNDIIHGDVALVKCTKKK